MLKKYYLFFLILLFLSLFASCTNDLKEKLIYTKWKNKAGNIFCNFTSKNSLELYIRGTKINYFYYIENNELKITNIKNFSQSLINYKDEKLHLEPSLDRKSSREIILSKVKEHPQ